MKTPSMLAVGDLAVQCTWNMGVGQQKYRLALRVGSQEKISLC
jgi:hypothetical protein